MMPSSSHAPAYTRFIVWIALAVSQMLIVSVLFDFSTVGTPHHNPTFYVTRLARWAAITVPIFVVLVWTERRQLAEQWLAMEKRSLIGLPLTVNLILFSLAAGTSAVFTAQAASSATPPWYLLSLLGALLAAMALSLPTIVVPFSGLGALISTWRNEAMLAGAVGFIVVILADAATFLWDSMADTTLWASANILKLYETDVVVDFAERGIRVGDFGVAIWHTCSGFEGLALVSGFVTVYLWTFRKELSFPRALILFPIGLAASWLLNAIRIAALVSLGAHVSPEMAVKGFHSQAGWIAFLGVALALMALSRRFKLATIPAKPAISSIVSAKHELSTRYEATVGYLMPFVALMLGSIAMLAVAPHDRPAYAVKVVLVSGALWLLRDRLGSWHPALPLTSVITGLLIGAAWIATTPSIDGASELGQWLDEIGPVMAVVWLALRAFGAIVLIPIAEELAFRGYLYRRLIGRDFHRVPWTAFSWTALIVSSLAFGLLHERWLAGALSGVAFGILMLYTGRLGSAMIAHASANALIIAWALAFQKWALL